MQIHTSITINAKPKEVWDVLVDFEKYPEWNPFVKSLNGNVKVGNQIQVKLQGMTFKPTVLIYQENEQFTWLGHLFFKGLFDGKHTFKLEDNGNGTITFHQSEKFKGILVPLFKPMLIKDTTKGFEDLNQKLKERVESKGK